MSIEIFVALIGVAGIGIAAFLARASELEKLRKDRITDAYKSYIEAQAAGVSPAFTAVMEKKLRGLDLTPEEFALFCSVNEKHSIAHANIILSGSRDVVRALSDFYSIVEGLRSERGRLAYSKLIEAMRRDGNADNYPEFAKDIDNISITGPVRRAELIAKAVQQGLALEAADWETLK